MYRREWNQTTDSKEYTQKSKSLLKSAIFFSEMLAVKSKAAFPENHFRVLVFLPKRLCCVIILILETYKEASYKYPSITLAEVFIGNK